MAKGFVKLNDLSLDVQQDIRSYLSTTESIELIIDSVYFNAEGTHGIGFVLLTNLRVLVISEVSKLTRKLFGGKGTCVYLNLNDLVNVQLKGSGAAIFKGSRFDIEVSCCPPHEIEQFAKIIVDRKNQTITIPTTSSKADRLRELQQLHADGLITDAEFRDQRQRILNSI